MALRLTFHGGAGKVTGANFFIEGARGKLLVDCGIEQGADFCEECVYGPFPYDPASIDALIVTHAHLDHVGRVPKLVRDGFKGVIYMTPPTRDLAELILKDSVGILGQEARRRGIAPLYEEADVSEAFQRMKTIEYHKEFEAAPGLSCFLRGTGHILGSGSVRVREDDGTALAVTGDIGNIPSPLLPDWEPVPDADALVMESVYGDRLHPPDGERVVALQKALRAGIERGGTILIPAFSLERTQLMLFSLSNFFEEGSLPKVPVFLDSPLAIKVTEVYERWGKEYFKEAAQAELAREGSIFEFPFLTQTLSREDSQAIEKVPGPKIIIAGAGMSHGGRIGKWESLHLPDPRSTLLIVGYQAPGSPGRRLVEGAGTVRIDGHPVRVKARVEQIDGWSAHADRDELLSYAKAALPRAKTIFTALGEPKAARFLAQRIHGYLGAHAVAPEAGQSWVIEKGSAARQAP